jgi:hypothetical protein
MFEAAYWFYRVGIGPILHDTNAVAAGSKYRATPAHDMSANGIASAAPGPSQRRQYLITFNIGL